MRTHMPLLLAACAIVLGGAVLAAALGEGIAGVAVGAIAGLAAVAIVAAFLPGDRHEREQGATAPGAPAAPLHAHEGFAGFFDALPGPLLLVGDGSVRAANRAARELLGGFIVGADVRTAIRHPAAADRLVGRIGDEPEGVIDLVGIGRAGARWEMRTAQLSGGERLVALTDRSQSDAVERMRADFVANASHELRTPLAAILGYVETLSDPAAGDDPGLRARFLGIMHAEARRMLRLVEDLLHISRIEASKAHLPEDRVDLAELARGVAGELIAATDPRAQDVVLDADGPAHVRGDAAQLAQLVHNVVSNAMKYGRAGTPVTLAVRAAGERMVELSVSDEGDGIPADALPRLTERFYRVDSARSRTLGGTGLGLAIVKHVTERHRGRLDIQSREGVGTTVRVRLPRAAGG